jgi:hypothetical protein
MKNTKKKKTNQFSSQEAAHHKKMYFLKILEIARIVSTGDSYKLLSKDMLEFIYNSRSRLIKVIADEKLNLRSCELQEIKNAIVYKLKTNFLKIGDTGKELSMYDFAGPGISLFMNLSMFQKYEPQKYPKLIAAFAEFLDTPEFLVEFQKVIYSITNYVGWELYVPDKQIVSPSVNYKVIKSPSPYLYIEVALNVYSPETIYVNFDGNVRPAFRVGVTYNGSEPNWVNLNAGNLCLDHVAFDSTIPVYIQNHALNRLKERIDCAEPAMIFLSLIFSLEDCRCITYRGNKLIEFVFLDHKIGYLLVDMVNGIAIVRTFLILTHFDTPEGDNLHRIIGLEKPDITYLNLDKLSTFVYSDIRDKAIVRDLFTRAGCEKLLDVPKKEFDKAHFAVRAQTIESYLLKYQKYKEQVEVDHLFKLDI